MQKFYKFRQFGVNSLSELCQSEIYFSDPKKFNDPLDCSPTININIKLNEIEALCHQLVKESSTKENADYVVHNCRYLSTEYGDYKKDKEVEQYYINLIVSEIQRQLDARLKSRGVFSLASDWSSPLMWSHYGDEHKGICVEYESSKSKNEKLKPVDYKATRAIQLSTIFDWVINGSKSSKTTIDIKYFYTKANQWSYEGEYRLVSDNQGSSPAPFAITGIYFGMRCPTSVVASIVKLMNGSDSNLNFYHAYANSQTFEILRREVDIDELVALTPRPSAALMFEKIK